MYIINHASAESFPLSLTTFWKMDVMFFVGVQFFDK